MASTGTFRGRGGVEWTFDLPMTEVYRNQIATGDLKPVDQAAKDYASTIEETGQLRTPPRDLDVDEPQPEPEPEAELEPEAAPEPAQPDEPAEPAGDPTPAERPPEAGPGSSRSAWAHYAQTQGVDVDDDDTRDDIIAKVDAQHGDSEG